MSDVSGGPARRRKRTCRVAGHKSPQSGQGPVRSLAEVPADATPGSALERAQVQYRRPAGSGERSRTDRSFSRLAGLDGQGCVCGGGAQARRIPAAVLSCLPRPLSTKLVMVLAALEDWKKLALMPSFSAME